MGYALVSFSFTAAVVGFGFGVGIGGVDIVVNIGYCVVLASRAPQRMRRKTQARDSSRKITERKKYIQSEPERERESSSRENYTRQESALAAAKGTCKKKYTI